MSPPNNNNAALGNCVGSSAHHGVALLMTPQGLVKLLVDAQRAPGDVQVGSKEILASMAKGSWRIAGGTGDRVVLETAGGKRTLQLHTVSCEIRAIR